MWVLLCLPFLYAVYGGNDETRFCANYATCLHQLEDAQRSCTQDSDAKILKFDEDVQCNLTRYGIVHAEIENLQLRKTEVIRDCVAKNVDKGVSFLASEQEHKCLNKAAKVNNRLADSHGSSKPQPVHDHLTKHRAHKGNESTNECHRQRKFLHVKCNQISICCSIATDCHLSARLIQQQINELKRELKKMKKNCQKNIALIEKF